MDVKSVVFAVIILVVLWWFVSEYVDFSEQEITPKNYIEEEDTASDDTLTEGPYIEQDDDEIILPTPEPGEFIGEEDLPEDVIESGDGEESNNNGSIDNETGDDNDEVDENVTGIERIDAVMVRRAADPGNSKTGPINAIVPEIRVPSHHGPDVNSVVGPDLNINTMAVKVPTTIMHLHCLTIQLKDKNTTKDQIIESMKKYPRILLISAGMGFKSTAEVMEYARESGRGCADLYEVAVWEDSVNVENGTLYFYQAIHQESDVVPENIDCVRAMMGSMDKDASIKKTDSTLGIV